MPPELRALLSCGFVLASPLASSAAAAEGQGDPEIVVTARRIEERTGDIPLNISVVPASEIGAGGIDGLQSLAARIPGLSYESLPGQISTPVLRGQHQPSLAGDAVAMFVDGVFQAHRDGNDVEPLDLERIEVLHGPQSAMFGHSSFAGLIHYVLARPTEELFVGGSADIGTDDLYGLRGTVSGPLDRTWKFRLAAGWRQADGTWANAARPGRHLGNFRKLSAAATIATRDGAGPLSVRLSGRYGESRFGQPPFYALLYPDFNCGGRDVASGHWTYFCGAAPVPRQVSLSPEVPESTGYTGQFALHLILDLGGAELRSDSSFYRAGSIAYRDFDAGVDGQLYGVCTIGVNCMPPAGAFAPVTRLQPVNWVQRNSRTARELAQELRLRGTGEGRFRWQLGAVVFWTRSRSVSATGGARGALAADERFTSLVLADPLRVGPPAFINNALVDDPYAGQIVQSDTRERRRTIAVFAAADYRLTETLRLRGEVRANWERLALDSRLAGFRPSFGKALGARTFFDATPRVSLDYRPVESLLVYASLARGSRSGGINAQPGLLPEEQSFAPETNWTSEAGFKYAGRGLIRSAQASAYHIDWRGTQIVGFPVTPGVGALITHNTRGIETWGIELAAELAPAAWLGVDIAYSRARARFKPGSEDPGSNGYCGVSQGFVPVSLCRIVPSRVLPRQVAPDVSGNVPARSVAGSWAAGATLAPQSGALAGLRLRIEATHQGNVYERQIDGLYYGARTLLNARLTVPLGAFAAELWGTNLAGDRYLRIGPGHGPQFYTGQPRPSHLVLGEGRRIGLTLRYPR